MWRPLIVSLNGIPSQEMQYLSNKDKMNDEIEAQIS